MMYSLRNKINQLFIVGYEGDDVGKCEIFKELAKNGLGGAIFFTKNIFSAEQFKKNTDKIKEMSLIAPFLSIDQEGGRVERTENIHGGKKYLSAKDAAAKGLEFVKKQTEELCEELLSFGINMNFAPVLDTNTNPKNPIIGVRAYGDCAEEVVKFAIPVLKIHKKMGIIPVGKHFPGHGDTATDSHLEMPIVKLSREEMAETHLKPFKIAIENGLEAIMVSHVYYTCYDETPCPASLSGNVTTNLLKNELSFRGLVLSDDMVMGAVSDKNPFEIYIKALKAGINVFLYRFSDENLLSIIDFIEQTAKNDEEVFNKINQSFENVVELKHTYKIL